MKISAYVRNEYLEPSGYYRITQYLRKLSYESSVYSIDTDFIYKISMFVRKNEFLHQLWQIFHYACYVVRLSFFLCYDYFRESKVVIVSRCFLPRICPRIFVKFLSITLKNKILIWDFDDNILGTALTQNEYKFLCRKAEKIIVTQAELAKMILPEYSQKVIFLPTTDGDMVGFDYDSTIRNRLEIFDREIHVLWLAMSPNLPFLKMAVRGLDMAAAVLKQRGKRLVLNVVCNLPLIVDVENLVVENVNWSREVGKQKLAQCHIGIMPLADNEFTRGKGAFKLIQYMAVGMPVIASDVGFNSDVVKDNFGVKVSKENLDEEWRNAVLQIVQDEKVWLRYSGAAKNEWNKRFSYDKTLMVWEKLIKDLCDGDVK